MRWKTCPLKFFFLVLICHYRLIFKPNLLATFDALVLFVFSTFRFDLFDEAASNRTDQIGRQFWCQPGLPGLAALYRLVRLMHYVFLKLLLCLYVKAGRNAWRDLGSRNRHLGKQAGPPSGIKWKQGMSRTSLVKRASRLANRAAWLKPSSKISVFHESSHEIQSIFILYCFPPIGAFRKQSLFYKYYRENLTNYNSQLSTNYNLLVFNLI